VKIIADTNVLVRFIVKDDEAQFHAVCRLFEQCDEIIIPTHVFCEFFWVLSGTYKINKNDVLDKMESLLDSDSVTANEDEVTAGLEMARKGGDFADGVNAYAGRRMTSTFDKPVFASFDRQAVRLLAAQGVVALIPE